VEGHAITHLTDCREGMLPTDAKNTKGGRYDISFPPKMRALNLVTNAHTNKFKKKIVNNTRCGDKETRFML